MSNQHNSKPKRGTDLALIVDDARPDTPWVWPQFEDAVAALTRQKQARQKIRNPLESIRASAAPTPPPIKWVVEGLIPAGYCGQLYGDGASCKTYTTIRLAMHVAACASSFCGLPIGVRGPVLYIDAEMDRDTFVRRTDRIAKGMGLAARPSHLHYLNLSSWKLSDPDAIDMLQFEIDVIRPVLIVIDSWQFATGVDPLNAGQIIEIFSSLKKWGPQTILFIDHEKAPQAGENERDAKNPYGNRYKYNAVRSSIRVVHPKTAVTRASIANGASVTTKGLVLTQLKITEGDERPDVYLRVIFEGDAKDTHIVRFDSAPANDPLFTQQVRESKRPARYLMLDALENHSGGIKAAGLAKELGRGEQVVKNDLSALKREGRVESSRGIWTAIHE